MKYINLSKGLLPRSPRLWDKWVKIRDLVELPAHSRIKLLINQV